MRKLLIPVVVLVTVSACDDSLLNNVDDTEFEACETDATIRGEIESHLGASLEQYELVLLDNAVLLSNLRQGQTVTLPAINSAGELVTVEVPSLEETVLSPNLTQFILKASNQEFTTTAAEDTDIFRLDCQQGSERCGMIAFLDASGQQLEAAIASSEFGFSLVESVSSLLTNLEGSPVNAEAGCHIVYNSDFHGALNFEEYPQVQGSPQGLFEGAGQWDQAAASHRLEARIPIILDSDHQFYSTHSSTVWRRQSNIIAFTNLIYGLLEPLSSNNFQILFEIQGQESWLPDFGPSSTDRDVLLDEINDPGYFMLNHPDNNELSYYFVGYDMTGDIAGKAGGICNLPDYDDTFGSSEEHQDNHAWGQQVADEDGGYAFGTLFGRIAVASHEIGHMLGALHSDGARATDGVCAGGSLSGMCGASIMRSGAAGGVAPDFRKPFFTDANDENMVTCVGDAL